MEIEGMPHLSERFSYEQRASYDRLVNYNRRVYVRYEELKSMVPPEQQRSLALANEIKSELPGAVYERLKPRKPGSAVSVYVESRGQRILSFDLKKGPGVRVYFWIGKHLDERTEQELGIKTEKGTGWKALARVHETDVAAMMLAFAARQVRLRGRR